MIHRGLHLPDFADAFKKFIPAIIALAAAKHVLPPDTPHPSHADDEASFACKLLIRLVPKYCKRHTNCNPDRLFVDGWDSTFINTMHQVRRARKQTAPMIFVLNNFPSPHSSYLVATDDFALTVRGTFVDALQSLMELHYVFDLAYAAEIKPFFPLLEKMANLYIKPSTTLMNLYHDLMRQADIINDGENVAPPIPKNSAQNGLPVAPSIPENSEENGLPDASTEFAPQVEDDILQID